jgi:hypothetical protein
MSMPFFDFWQAAYICPTSDHSQQQQRQPTLAGLVLTLLLLRHATPFACCSLCFRMLEASHGDIVGAEVSLIRVLLCVLLAAYVARDFDVAVVRLVGLSCLALQAAGCTGKWTVQASVRCAGQYIITEVGYPGCWPGAHGYCRGGAARPVSMCMQGVALRCVHASGAVYMPCRYMPGEVQSIAGEQHCVWAASGCRPVESAAA